jgi:uncharacterized protein
MKSHQIVQRWIHFNTRNPLLILLLFSASVILSLWISTHLKLNTDQLDLLNPKMRFIQDIHRVNAMIGGAGQLTIAFKGDNSQALKQVAADLANHLLTDRKEQVRQARYKMPIEFVKKNAALFMQSDDLVELKRRVMLKVKDAQKRADPFFFEITPTKPVELLVDDLIDRYSKVGKKSIRDEYYMSTDRKMQLLFVKPVWGGNVLDKTGELVKYITHWLSRYKGQSGTINCVPIQAQTMIKKQPESADTIRFGFTGTYQSNYDDSFQISESLLPVSGIALAGVLIVLLSFFRRNLFAIFLILSGLLFGLAFTFAWATICIGELNMITSILGGILMGLGIDFGIHFLYRLREELTRQETLNIALQVTISGAGWASIFSGLGSMAAFASLLMSDFKGFSEFGFLAGSGVFLIGLSIYIWVPAVLLGLEKYKPGLAIQYMSLTSDISQNKNIITQRDHAKIPRPKLILTLSTLITLSLIAFAPMVPFEYNTRALMVEGLPSLQLQDEIKERFNIGSDPVAIYTKTLDQALKVYEFFKQQGVNVGLQSQQNSSLTTQEPKKSETTSLPNTQQINSSFKTVDQVLSLYTFVPPMIQQNKNYKILKKWKQELANISVQSLPPELQDRWQEGLSYLQAKPFTVDHLPLVYRQNFVHLPQSDPAVHGYLTFVYAGVDLWDGKNMLAFAAEIEKITAEQGPYYSAGMPILLSHLTKIILRDARLTVFLTGILLFLILLIDFKRLGYTLIALTPLFIGLGSMLGIMTLIGAHLNLMNMVVFPIIIGYGVSHAVYFLHRVKEGQSPAAALHSIGRAIACSTLTTLAGWAALLAASHKGLQSMGILACIGMLTTLIVSLTLMPALLELWFTKTKSTLNSPKTPSLTP